MTARKFGLLLTSMLGAMGCAHTPSRAAPVIEFYKGIAIVHQPGGRDEQSGPNYRKRTIDPVQGTVTEQVVRAAVGPHEPASETVAIMKVEGSHMVTSSVVITKADGSRMVPDNTGVENSIDLVGEPWHWNRWTNRVRISGGWATVSESTVEGNRLNVETTVTDPHIGEVMRVSERFEAIDEPAFEAGRKQLLGL